MSLPHPDDLPTDFFRPEVGRLQRCGALSQRMIDKGIPIIDHFYQQHHRRLCKRFGLARIERHEARIMRALDSRRRSTR